MSSAVVLGEPVSQPIMASASNTAGIAERSFIFSSIRKRYGVAERTASDIFCPLPFNRNSMTAKRINWTRRRALLVVFLAIASACATVPMPVRQTGDTMIYIVRHANRASLVASEPDPDLSAEGHLRAQTLANRLGQAGITHIIVTNLKRTQETAEPIATQLFLVPEIVPVTVTGHADSVVSAIRRHTGESILVVGHSNSVPAIIELLGGPRMPEICANKYSDLYVVTIPASGGTRVNHLHYGAADPLNSNC
jgi:phosphohistidine phosphatase SixA